MTDYLGNMKGVAFITGAGSGIGRVCARNMAKLGAKLVLVDMNAASLDSLVTELSLPSSHILTAVLNICDTPAVEKFVASVPGKMDGRIDFALFCAGILGPDYDTPLHEQKQSAWDLVLDLNLKAQAVLTREVVKIMLKQSPLPSQLERAEGRRPGTINRRGAIVNFTSMAGLHARSQSGAPYIASKHGLIGLTKVTGVTYGKDGIRCNAVAPAFIRTPLVSHYMETAERVAKTGIPLNRVGEPEEVADLAIWLCSERSSFINGSCGSSDVLLNHLEVAELRAVRIDGGQDAM